MQGQQVGDIAVEAIDQIMQRKRIPHARVGFDVAQDATFRQVMQYIWRYVGNGTIQPERPQGQGHRYRIDRYRDLISQADITSAQIRHIDIGCGGGTFTWALLEWCISEGIDLKKVQLHSYDRSRKMVKAAKMIHQYIRKQHTQYIPEMRAHSNYMRMLRSMPTKPKSPTHYIITAGYVLANNHSDEAIEEFTAIIIKVIDKADDNLCSLIVGDASQTAELDPAYKSLVDSLEDNGVDVNTWRRAIGMRIAQLRR